jgi:hypothetical protein
MLSLTATEKPGDVTYLNVAQRKSLNLREVPVG